MVAGSESSKFRACGSNIYDPNSRGGTAYLHATQSTNGIGCVGWDITNGPNILSVFTDPNRTASANLNVNLQNGNAIYGASDTVQPKTLRSYFLIRYA